VTRVGHRAGRALAAAGLAEGVGLLARPAAVVRTVCAGAPEPPVWVARLLGGRLVLQSALVLLRPSRGTLLTGAAVDVLHGASMLAVAGWLPAYRRAAVASAALAAVAAGLGALAAREPGR
jgi:hypothetical protein